MYGFPDTLPDTLETEQDFCLPHTPESQHCNQCLSPRPLVRLSTRIAALTLAAYPAGHLPAALPGYPVGGLFLRQASHLDAFSAYPCRTWLPSDASGETTGTPLVRPPRSSRTRGSSSQASYARDG